MPSHPRASPNQFRYAEKMTDIHDFQADIGVVNQIAVLPTILEFVSKTTGMGFAAVARVTEDRWIACSVRDEILFGLEPGGGLTGRSPTSNGTWRSPPRV